MTSTLPLRLAVGLTAVFAVVFALLLFPLEDAQAESLNTAAISAALLGLCVLAIWTDRESRTQPFTGLSLAAIFTGVGFAFRGIQLSFGAESPVLSRAYGNPRDHLTEAAMLLLLGFIGTWSGYRSTLGARLATSLPLVRFEGASGKIDQRKWLWLYAIYVLGWGARIILWRFGYFHANMSEGRLPGGVVPWVRAIAGMATGSLWLIYAAKHRRNDRLSSFVPLSLCEFAYGAIDGGRTNMLGGLIAAAITWGLFRPKPLTWSKILPFLALFIIVIAPLATIFRQSYYEVMQSEGGGGVSQATEAMSSAQGDVSIDRMQQSRDDVALRYAFFDSAPIVLDRVPGVYEFQYGEEVLPFILAAPIPRLFWPDKPISRPGRRNAIMFYDDQNREDLGTNNNIPLAAELYFNWGWWGLVLMPFVGLWVRFHWERFRIYSRLEISAAARFSYVWVIASPVLSLEYLFGSIWRIFFDLYFFLFLAFGIPRLVRASRTMLPESNPSPPRADSTTAVSSESARVSG